MDKALQTEGQTAILVEGKLASLGFLLRPLAPKRGWGVCSEPTPRGPASERRHEWHHAEEEEEESQRPDPAADLAAGGGQ